MGAMAVQEALMGAIKGFETRVARAARRRGQRPGSVHALLVALQDDTVTSGICAEHGIFETAVLSLLEGFEESHHMLEVALERASSGLGVLCNDGPGRAERVESYVLGFVLQEPRSAAHRCVQCLGVAPLQVTRALWSAAGVSEPNVARARGASQVQQAPMEPLGVHAAPRRDLIRIRGFAGRDAEPSMPPPAPVESGQPVVPADVNDFVAPGAAGFCLDAEEYPVLFAVGRNLSAMALHGELDPVLERDGEMDQLLDVLARRRTNNALLVGPPGVGKSAIVEGLAQRIVRELGETAPWIIQVSPGALVANTGVRGALADKMRALVAETQRLPRGTWLFIDEIHAVVGGDGPDDLAQELKVVLTDGALPIIGATTEAEYHRQFRKDAALDRRFSVVHVREPSVEGAVRLLTPLAVTYGEHHAVHYEDDAVQCAAVWSARYISDRALPAKALDLLDQAGARVSRRGGTRVDSRAVGEVVSERTGIPAERVMETDAERFVNLHGRLRDHIVGQDAALTRICETLQRSAAGMGGERPLATFLFLGPSGVGKTETAKAIAREVFPKGAVTRIDMSELSEAHGVSRLVGAPPGYVGHEQGGQLTEALRRRPYQVILLDEVEKAHPQALMALLPLLDEGRMTDGMGQTVDGRHCVIVMTSNLGAEAAVGKGSIGFDAASGGLERAAAVARRSMAPELWNRIDEVIPFCPLSDDDVEVLTERLLQGVAARFLRGSGVHLRMDGSVVQRVLRARRNEGEDPALGARPMRRLVGRLVETPLALRILRGEIRRGQEVTVSFDGTGWVMEPVLAAPEGGKSDPSGLGLSP